MNVSKITESLKIPHKNIRSKLKVLTIDQIVETGAKIVRLHHWLIQQRKWHQFKVDFKT